ncbi:MAG TPA: ergothioneine biosynthesis protein EgtB [Nitrosospira sp.]|nr:ergothioneine biosynthesis protein EgtB [Nitrosospira sp.]
MAKLSGLSRENREDKDGLLSSKPLALYDEIRQRTLKLVDKLTPEDQMVQSMPDASPSKWHIAHTTWFFETFILEPHMDRYSPFEARFGSLFNSYYKRLGPHPHRSLRGTFSRPSLDEVLAYRRYVDNAVHTLFMRKASAELLPLLELGLNHEQQHQELIVTDIKHAFWTNPLRPACYPRPSPMRLVGNEATGEPAPSSWHGFDGGLHEMGHDRSGFAFDNEMPRHSVFIKPFSMASRLVTNAEYQAFIANGGYECPELWLSDAWDRVCGDGWRAPLYWEKTGKEWMHFTCHGMQPLVPEEPVCHVSYYEADAFARWSGVRLPTEFEWELAAGSALASQEIQKVAGNMLEDETYHPGPAEHASGHLQQLFGDAWEWTCSPYSPYPGYRPPAGLEGEYNGKFMCNQMVLRGGSCATPASHIRKSYRNYFAPQARWQFSGIRLARDEAAS